MNRIICLDLDGMIFDLVRRLLVIYNRTYGTNVEPWEVWSTPSVQDPARSVADVIDDYLWQDGLFEDLPFLPGAEEAIAVLKEMGHLMVVSAPSRNPDSAMHKLKEVQGRLGVHRKDIALLKRKALITGDAWLEDWHDNITQIRERHPMVFIGAIEYPYNAHLGDVATVLAKDHRDTQRAWSVLIENLDAFFHGLKKCHRLGM